ncbi:hypothetical protein NPIL_573331 [Nephila pilipes]|uniref:Uncharacterized protein n=1 Tax=Nephila pilipes TaxID=299642 RepID=A0A8X6TU27_NEPPI|nr:hypothetical protein NPIL_573331 [Nephila pilipes]
MDSDLVSSNSSQDEMKQQAKVYRTDRLTYRGGGTALLTKKSIEHHCLNFHTLALETTTINIETEVGSPITICSAYKPPRKSRFVHDL